jgi:hypothetical protein
MDSSGRSFSYLFFEQNAVRPRRVAADNDAWHPAAFESKPPTVVREIIVPGSIVIAALSNLSQNFISKKTVDVNKKKN